MHEVEIGGIRIRFGDDVVLRVTESGIFVHGKPVPPPQRTAMHSGNSTVVQPGWLATQFPDTKQ